MPATQEQLSKVFSRVNPFYSRNSSKWERSLEAYGGGEEYICKALIKHLAEVQEEYEERQKRAYYINYPAKLVKLIVGHLLGKTPSRDGADEELVKDWSRTGLSADDVMRQFAALYTVCGCAWLAVDMPTFEGTVTKAQEQAQRLRPYCLALSALSVPDWSYGGDGKLDWVITKESYLEDSDPFKDPVKIEVRKLWTRQEVLVVKKDERGDFSAAEPIKHGLGEVPFIRYVAPDGYAIARNHWFEDAVRISDAILNNESEAQMNTVKQMYGQLVIPEDMATSLSSLPAPKDGTEKPITLQTALARSASLTEDAESKGICRYISPDGANTVSIRSENVALKRELVEVVGLALSQDGDSAQSGISKEWDFQNMGATFATLAGQMEGCEGKAWDLMVKWKSSIRKPSLSYNRIFAVIELKAQVEALLQLKGFSAGKPEFERSVDKAALSVLQKLQQLPQDELEAILQEIRTADYSLGSGSVPDAGGVDNPAEDTEDGVPSAGT